MDDCHVEPCANCGKGVMLNYYKYQVDVFCNDKCKHAYLDKYQKDTQLQCQEYEDDIDGV